MKELLERVCKKQDLTVEEARTLADAFLEPSLSQEQMAAVLIALKTKGETVEELAGFAESMRSHAVRIRPKAEAVDTCGTGGDCARTFNVSTAAAFVASAAGVPVAKHGNKSVSSASGSADVLEAFGANIMLSPEKTTGLIERIGFGFLFAPLYHPAMKHVAPVRKALGVKTIFNLLGPLANPAGVERQVIGVYDKRAQEAVASAAQKLGTKKTLVVFGEGVDEAFGVTRVLEVTPRAIEEKIIDAGDFGVCAKIEELRATNANESAEKVRNALSGENAESRIVALNAALALYAAGKAKSIEEGFRLASEAIRFGAALSKLEEYVEASGK